MIRRIQHNVRLAEHPRHACVAGQRAHNKRLVQELIIAADSDAVAIVDADCLPHPQTAVGPTDDIATL